LYFAAAEGDQPGQRVFDIRLQGKTVSQRVDVVQQAGAVRKALLLEFDQVQVHDNLAIELVPQSGTSQNNLPSLCAIEVLRSGAHEIVRQVAQDR
jgi:hypothetical protein